MTALLMGSRSSFLRAIKKATSPLERKPWVLIDLFSYKRTFVIASAEIPFDATAVSFSHRLTPRGNSLIQVTCGKR